MDAPLRTLESDGYDIAVKDADRFNRYRFSLRHDETIIGRGTHFVGGRHIRPWIELQPAVTFDPDSERNQALFDALTGVLEPGSHLMVHYLDDAVTARTITANVPPAATPLGFLMWRADIRWFKDWYFTEGWMEGDQKLQGNLPVDDETRQEREEEMREALQAFLAREEGFDTCRSRAERLLATLD